MRPLADEERCADSPERRLMLPRLPFSDDPDRERRARWAGSCRDDRWAGSVRCPPRERLTPRDEDPDERVRPTDERPEERVLRPTRPDEERVVVRVALRVCVLPRSDERVTTPLLLRVRVVPRSTVPPRMAPRRWAAGLRPTAVRGRYDRVRVRYP